MTVTAPLYAQILGGSWNQLAEPLRRLHGTDSITRAHGNLRIEHGRHPLARLLARMLRLPQPTAAAETQLVVVPRADGEHWQRTFNTHRLETLQYPCDGELAERFGAFEFRFRLEASGGSLRFLQREAFACWHVRLRIPARFAPRVDAREDPAGPERIQVEVRVTLPWVGLLISYAGLIEVGEMRS